MKSKLNIVADAHIWSVQSAFSTLPGHDVNLQVLENRQITAERVRDADILLTRSATRVNADLLQSSRVRFAATATIGDDHYDKAWLDAQGIAWANAAGSSTGSVLEYMMAALLDLHQQGRINIPQSAIGIIGAGRIGGALAELCTSLGMKVLLNDPPRARQEGDDQFCSLDEVLMQADILTIHTPLIRSGEDNTVHLLSDRELQAFSGVGIINAARGSCVDSAALCDWLDQGDGRFAVMDCWEDEPKPLARLIKHAGMAIATPHIAGHSVEGKAANTQSVYNALCKYLEIKPAWDMHAVLPDFPAVVELSAGDDMWHTLHAAVSALYPISDDHAAMQSWADLLPDDLALAFVAYRRNYPARRSWQHAPLSISDADSQTLQMADAIGIKIV
ncbi:4-phosphoerythronate dehydrogenase [Mariprofundus sp. EBB-1]|uniref:4-phosphoerythronate dehydrogenase n=1 Tax=Mariprofundus sp. EBB-1 TaxID=2650971 RepID=UPI000EF284B5|nr:4-phosphoerythronate dehydrogenase [Mariprofundus sp. EBB-1]RLL52744.1 4-phosphoerythronate dehydrogenase [Mariprofundus sp. EBB-1]